jgi:hypothetical protein
MMNLASEAELVSGDFRKAVIVKAFITLSEYRERFGL